MNNLSPARERSSILHAARDRIAKARAERDDLEANRRELPAAICRTCGGAVPAGTGTRDPEPSKLDPAIGELLRLDPIADMWRRACEPCSDAASRRESEARAVSAILDRAVTQPDAAAIVARVRQRHPTREGVWLRDFPTAQASATWTGAAWGHVTDDERERLRAAMLEVRGERLPARCEDGACGLCGVAEALVWHEGPSTLCWATNGSQAPLCESCWTIWTLRGEPSDDDDLARVVVEACTGLAIALGYFAPEGVRAFAASAAADPKGFAEPWAFSPGIADLRRTVWTARPHLAPADMRAHAEQWHRDELAEQARRARSASDSPRAGEGW